MACHAIHNSASRFKWHANCSPSCRDLRGGSLPSAEAVIRVSLVLEGRMNSLVDLKPISTPPLPTSYPLLWPHSLPPVSGPTPYPLSLLTSPYRGALVLEERMNASLELNPPPYPLSLTHISTPCPSLRCPIGRTPLFWRRAGTLQWTSTPLPTPYPSQSSPCLGGDELHREPTFYVDGITLLSTVLSTPPPLFLLFT